VPLETGLIEQGTGLSKPKQSGSWARQKIASPSTMQYPLKVQARREETRYESHKSQTSLRGASVHPSIRPSYPSVSPSSGNSNPLFEGVAVSRENNQRP